MAFGTAQKKASSAPAWLKALQSSVTAIFASAVNPVFTAQSNPIVPSWVSTEGTIVEWDAESAEPTEYLYEPENGEARTLVGFAVMGRDADGNADIFKVPGTVGAAIIAGQTECTVQRVPGKRPGQYVGKYFDEDGKLFGLEVNQAKELFGIQ